MYDDACCNELTTEVYNHGHGCQLRVRLPHYYLSTTPEPYPEASTAPSCWSKALSRGKARGTQLLPVALSLSVIFPSFFLSFFRVPVRKARQQPCGSDCLLPHSASKQYHVTSVIASSRLRIAHTRLRSLFDYCGDRTKDRTHPLLV